MSQSKRNIFSFDSKFSDLLIRFTGIVTVNFLWLLCCLPIVTAGAATKAMYASLDIVARLEDGAAKGFFFAFRKQFWTTTSLWMLILFVGIGLVVDFMILANWEFFGRIGMYVVLFLVSFLLLVFLWNALSHAQPIFLRLERGGKKCLSARSCVPSADGTGHDFKSVACTDADFCNGSIPVHRWYLADLRLWLDCI